MDEPDEFETDAGPSRDSDSASSEEPKAKAVPSPEHSASPEEPKAAAVPSSDSDSTPLGEREAEPVLSSESIPISSEEPQAEAAPSPAADSAPAGEPEAEAVPWFLSRPTPSGDHTDEAISPSDSDSTFAEGHQAGTVPSFVFDSISSEEPEAGAVPSLEPIFDLAPSSPRFAARAFGCSVLLHVAALMMLWGFPWRIFYVAPKVQLEAAREAAALLLPPLGWRGGGGSAPGGGGQPSAGKSGTSAPGVGKRAPRVVFRGPQPIVSNPPNPDNSLQTIRQPDLFRPPKLKRPIPSPNIVLIAPHPQPPPAKPAQRAAIKAVRSGAPIPISPQPPEVLQPPKLTLPPSGETAFNIMGGLPANQPAAPKLQAPPPAPMVSQEGSDASNLLVLNAVPAPVPPPSSIPAGELSGAFTVSPNPNAEANAKAAMEEAGTGSGSGTGTQGSGAGSQAGAGTGTGTSGSGSGGGGGSGAGGSGSGAGPGLGTGPGAGGGPGGSGQGAGGGRGSGGTGAGSGSGADLGGPGGSGDGPFKDVAIGEPPRLEPPTSRPKLGHQSFALTIVATSSTGGGLKDYGVFRDQVVYTVYVDVDEPGHHRPRWTLQYAEIGTPSDFAPAAVLLPPYPVMKEFPHLPEVASRHVGRMIVATGVVNKKGALTALKVIQSPNPLLIEPVLDSLAKWTFQAAELNGEPIEVRVLLGIPISADLIEGGYANTAK